MAKTVLCLTLGALLAMAGGAYAQWSNDPNQNTVVATSAASPSIISDGAGGAIIAYYHYLDYRLHAQRLNNEGYACWDSGGVLIGGNWQYPNFGLFPDGCGGCFISYMTPTGQYYAKIYAQKLDSDGNRLWNEDGIIICNLDSNQATDPRVAADGLGGGFISWEDYRNGEWRVYLQHVDVTGNITWVPNGICVSGSTSQYYNLNPRILAGGTGIALLFWYEAINRIWGQRIDPNGNYFWGQDGIVLAEQFRDHVLYLSDNHGGAVVSAMHPAGSYDELYSQRIDSSGAFVWGENGVLLADSVSSTQWASGLNSAGEFYVWANGTLDSSYIALQHLDQIGNLVWGAEGLVISQSGISCGIPGVAACDDSSVVATWCQTPPLEMVAQKYDPQGHALWSAGLVTVSYNTYGIAGLNIISDMAGGSIFCWTIYPAILYAQQVSANGNLGEVLGVNEDPDVPFPAEITILPSFPNPFNPTTVLRYQLPHAGQVALAVYDLSGRHMATLTDGYRDAGRHQVSFDGTNLASGIYLARLSVGEFTETQKMVLLK